MKTKTFDCVEMKDRIQARILEEFAGLSPQEQRERTQREILDDPAFGAIWREQRERLPARVEARSASRT